MYKIKLCNDLPKAVSGVIDHREGTIKVNANKNYLRQQISLCHELLHLVCYLNKVNISEQMVHFLSVNFVNEIFPRLREFEGEADER